MERDTSSGTGTGTATGYVGNPGCVVPTASTPSLRPSFGHASCIRIDEPLCCGNRCIAAVGVSGSEIVLNVAQPRLRRFRTHFLAADAPRFPRDELH